MQKYFFIFVLFFMCSCNHNRTHKFQVPEYEKMADRLTLRTAIKLKKEKNLTLVGIGGGMMDHIRMMSMSFVYKNEIDIEAGRDLLVSCLNEYLNAINSDEKLRPHLVNYPFEPKNVEIWIYIHRSDNQRMDLGKISFISSIEGNFKYKIDKDPHNSEIIYKETYEEAIAKIKATNDS